MRPLPPHYLIIGGGCYGAFYVRQLTAARDRGHLDFKTLRVLDHDPDCLVARTFAHRADVELICADWLDAADLAFARRRAWHNDHLVPAPIAPHIAFGWLLRHLDAHASPTPWTGPAPDLPFAQVIRDGTLVLSHAPGACPINCVEPRRCPLTDDWRDWTMRDTLLLHNDRHRLLDRLHVLSCQHHAFGVGTIPLADLYDAADQLRDLASRGDRLRVGVATVSACHGVLDVLLLGR